MPVMNPKTGEMDHVDLSIVNKIIVEPEYLHDFDMNEKKKIDFSIIGDEEANIVTFQAMFPLETRSTRAFKSEQFETIMSRVVHSDTQLRLEQTEEFKNATDSMIENYISNQRGDGKLFSRIDEIVSLDNGIGIIHDLKANQDVGTFETLVFCVKKNTNETHFDILDILSGVRSMKDLLDDPTRYRFSYYALDTQTIYEFIVLESGRGVLALDETLEGHSDQSIRMNHVQMEIRSLETEKDKVLLIEKANETKNTLRGVASDDFLHSQYVEQFNSARFDILKVSEQKAKKAQMMNKYADLELF
ncbi:hypothetical protein GZH47_33250 (plasmid) [Paenibacillus rhizovicinus]|uniref:Uncharacterized protein n=1 Tax=Paenibacillus rhizovicinus TaxID=2704463 RepID=A0A6C0PCY9_9BACL|nr:hypothetical protein [Paenibacillus rhizovicinus]QHW35762.1 hypothetical protein GZH47_33250 [Paenibacillus rhizovicinus]